MEGCGAGFIGGAGAAVGGVGIEGVDVRGGVTGAVVDEAGGVETKTGEGIGVAPFFINISMLCEYAWAK